MLRFSLLALAGAPLLAQDSPDDFRVAYTGRLLGYARTPDVQVLFQRPGGGPPIYDYRRESGVSSPVASALRRQVAEFRSAGGASLLLGMGDNFAMDYRARTVLIHRVDGSRRWVRKDQLVFDTERNGWADLTDKRDEREERLLQRQLPDSDARIDADNVATFVEDLGFDALVPGVQDFHFGPQRLRQLARLLATSKRPVPILASNLVIRASSARPVVPKPEHRLDAVRGFSSHHGVLAWTPPAAPLPWMRRVRLRQALTNGKENYKELRWCPASSPLGPCPLSAPTLVAVPDPASQREHTDAWIYVSAREALVFTREELRRAELRRDPGRIRDALAAQVRQLEQSKAASVPVFPLDPDKDYTACAYFADGSRPYCSTIRIAKPLFDHKESLDRPYAVRHGIVILGAVARGLERSIGALNAQWLHSDPGVDVGVVASEPAEALSQTLEYCRAKGDCGPGTRYLLMAQMPEPEAETLNRQLRSMFLAVFAQPDEYTATSPAPVEYPSTHAALTFVPPPVYVNGDVTVALRSAEFRRQGPRARHEVVTGSAPASIVHTRDEGPDCLSARAERVSRIKGLPPRRRFETLVLESMRKAAGSDAAILQKRDLFELDRRVGLCSSDPAAFERERVAVEQILWKGDMLATRTITGAQLKGILAQSDAYDALDRDPYADHDSPNRGLLTLGLMKDSGVWFINGQAISDNRLFSVAMPDFLAFGDTGYTDLRRQPVPPGIRVTDLRNKTLTPIADLVLGELGLAKPVRLPAGEYLDRSSQTPPDAPIRASFLDQLREQARHWGVLYPAFRPGTPEAAGQSRTYWRLFADQGSIGYTEYRNNQPSAAVIAQRFQGITESGINSRESRTWLAAAQVELRRESPWGNLFTRTETGFSNQVLQAAVSGGDLTRNYLDNRIGWETGVRRAIFGNARQRPWMGVLASFQTASQVRRPFEVLAGSSTAIAIPRTRRVYGKFGLRVEGRQSWIEAGLLAGQVRRARPDLTGSITEAGANRENGYFLNFNSVLPLPRGIGVREFTFTNRTLYFWSRPSDLPVDTRLLERFDASVTVPVWGNVSLRPTYGLLLFENKKQFNFLAGRTFSIRLDYRFDRSSGASWKQVLGFGRP